ISYKDMLSSYPWFLKLVLYSLPIPYISSQLGWILAEVGRQPWVVYGLLKTKDAVSTNLTTTQVLFTFSSYLLIYTILAVVAVFLMMKNIRKGLD
ncbi:MAG: cytochrome ubiquinol oxidase subunit I, partial [Burkholderiales bacterium]